MMAGRARACERRACVAAIALALLAAPALGLDDEIDWQAADGSFPDHGGCTYFGPTEGAGILHTAADDLRAVRERTADTRRVLAMIPQPRRGGVFVRPRAAAAPGASTPCEGIDDCIQKTADAAGVPLTYLTTDSEFLRRVRLDLTGRIPTKDEVLSFLADTSETKRADLVDKLLTTPEWADRWAMFLGDLFQNTQVTAQVNRYPHGRDSFHLYLLESLRANKPYDVMAREMIAAEGTSDGRTYPDRYTSFEQFQSTYGDWVGNPVKASPVGYVVGGRTTGGPIQDTYDALAFVVARDFLGIGAMDCVLCHDGEGHLDSLSVWGAEALRLEGWRLAAFFSDIPRHQAWRVPGRTLPMDPTRNRRVNANYYFIHDLPLGVERRAGNGDTAGIYLGQTEGGNRPDRLHQFKAVEPEYPFETSGQTFGPMRLRQKLGIKLTADLQFARAAVNYIWRELFSRGFVEPPDQFDLSRLDPASPPPTGWSVQPSHPRLLDFLAEGFADSGFDLKWLMKEITTSQTYQLSSRYEGAFNPLHEKYFVRRQAKRLTAEQVHDALIVASGRIAYYNVSRAMRGLGFAMQFPDVVNMPPGGARDRRDARQLLQAFMPGDRQAAPRSGAASPLQALNLMNNRFVLTRVDPRATVGTLADSLELSDDGLVASLYLSVLSRHPSEQEATAGLQYIQGGDRGERASNLIWSLFNKTDFYFNY